ncbi:dihydrolipoyl mitochondrial precursor [Phlyctema vagabunda]|uniref:Dihydrolipoyl mitochondrial n=1 Tax=Phlyctema vagabunda TaxID=108571 RepID=A0ABR4PS69_9HELO
MPPTQNLLKLPAKLVEELGGQDALAGNGRKGRLSHTSRKELRKAGRAQKKVAQSGPPPVKRQKTVHYEYQSTKVHEKPTGAVSVKRMIQTDQAPSVAIEPVLSPPKSILKRTRKASPIAPQDRNSFPRPPPISRAIKHKLDEDEEEIAALEKKLGIKGRKSLPQAFKDDGLDELLAGLDSEDDADLQHKKSARAENDEWLAQKRRAARGSSQIDQSRIEDTYGFENEDERSSDYAKDVDEDEIGSNLSIDDTDDLDELLEGSDTAEDSAIGHDRGWPERDQEFDGFDSDHSTVQPPAPRFRENPYVAPTSNADGAPLAKYIPPSMRKAPASDTELLIRLKRQIQGLVNRLTEANLLSILSDIEKIYRNNARQHVTSTLVDLLLNQVCEPTSLPDTSVIVPAGFISAVYKVIGTDFGAQVIQRTVELFDGHYGQASGATGYDDKSTLSRNSKETSNLITLLSELYNFQVVGSNLMFDYIRLFLSKLSELNAELLLKLIRTSGPQLRQDDPAALKDIMTMLRPAISSVGEENLSVRTKFMIETMDSLKNNRLRTGAAASVITSEHTIRMKKTLGTLNTRSIKASEPLRIGLKDIHESDKKGKWWLVGASWSGASVEDESTMAMGSKRAVSPGNKNPPSVDNGVSDLAQLATEQRMNTDIRRAIFITIMSASDFQDAYLRLMKLKLKKVQELEIPKVLIRCSSAEQSYNPYYTLIAKKLCGDRKIKMAFQFSLWDLFGKMGETDDDDDIDAGGDGDGLDTRSIVNIAKMYGTLIAQGVIGLGVLKNLNLTHLQSKTSTFVEILLITVFLQTQIQASSTRDESVVTRIFSRITEAPQLIRGMQYFLKKVVSRTDISGGRGEEVTVKWGCKVAANVLRNLVATDSGKS